MKKKQVQKKQVKQQKKSSNKWICSICNEKQSVRNVFASSMSAKDIRIFVQQFNLSRNRISLVDHNSADADTHGYTEVQEKNEGEEEKPFANRYEEHGFHQYEDEFGCLNVQRNISYYDDPLKKESSCDKYTAPQVSNDISESFFSSLLKFYYLLLLTTWTFDFTEKCVV